MKLRLFKVWKILFLCISSLAIATEGTHDTQQAQSKIFEEPAKPRFQADMACMEARTKHGGHGGQARLDSNNGWILTNKTQAEPDKLFDSIGSDPTFYRLKRIPNKKGSPVLWILETSEAKTQQSAQPIAVMKDLDSDGYPDTADFFVGNEMMTPGLTHRWDCSTCNLDRGAVRDTIIRIKLDNSWAPAGKCLAWQNPVDSLLREAFNRHAWRPKMAEGSTLSPLLKRIKDLGLNVLGKSTEKTKSGQDFTVSVLDEDSLNNLYRIMEEQAHIPFGYPADGCYARAHEMSYLLELLGIETGKVFVEGSLKVKTKNSPSGEVSWWYHVAPFLRVVKNGESEKAVIDPSLFELSSGAKIPSVEDWVRVQTQHSPQTPSLYFTPRFNYQAGGENPSKWESFDWKSVNTILREYLRIQKFREAEKEKSSSRERSPEKLIAILTASPPAHARKAASFMVLAFEDYVRSLKKTEEGRFEVTFMLHAAIYWVKEGSTRNDLEKAKASNKLAKVNVNVDSMEILSFEN